MKEAKEEEQSPAPVAGFTMEQVEEHYSRIMAEPMEQASPMSAFRMLQEEQRHNLRLLSEHQLAARLRASRCPIKLSQPWS